MPDDISRTPMAQMIVIYVKQHSILGSVTPILITQRLRQIDGFDRRALGQNLIDH
jgi:hypothetical protein